MSEEQLPENQDQNAEVAEPAVDERSDLDLAIWAVIGFDGCIAEGLTYDQAVKAASQALEKKTAGICIVSDDAAARIKARQESVL